MAIVKNARTRILLALLIVIILLVAFFVWRHEVAIHKALSAQTSVATAPVLQSVPGSEKASQSYVDKQQIQNAQNVTAAYKKSGSAVPTITRSGFIGSISAFTDSGNTPTATTCAMDQPGSFFKPDPAACTVANLKLARQAGVNAKELRCENCACENLKAAGFLAADLRDAGFTAPQMQKCGFSLQDLIAAGFSAADLRAAGFTAAQLEAAGFTAAQLKAAGFSAAELKAAGFTAAELKAAGFSATELKDAGFSAADLKAAGFTAAELKGAGFTAAELQAAGFTAAQLQAAGLGPNNKSPCSPDALKKERAEGLSAVDLKEKGCSAADLKAAGYTAAELKAAGFSAAELKDAGFSAADLKAAGFTAAQLKDAGFTAAQLKDAGFSASELKAAGFSAADLKAAGFTAAQLKAAGFSAAELKAAGFSAAQLKDAGFSAAELRAAGFSASQLKDAGFSAADLKAAGFSAADLRAAGFTPGDLLRAGFSAADAGYVAGKTSTTKIENLCSEDSLTQARLSGVSLQTLRNEGCSDAALRAAGFIIPNTNGLNANMQLPDITGNSETAQVNRIRQLQMLQASIQDRRDMLNQTQAQMSAQATQLLQDWSRVGNQQYAAGTPPVNAGGAGAAGANVDMTAGGPVYKAGSVFFGVIDTAINSDEPSPILAEIVGGPLKGAKLIGQFTRVDQRVLISFNVLNLPSLAKTISINAVAIDPVTARTAISGDVNNHYLLRYGSLFASSFLSGFAQGIQQQGTTSCFGPFCTTTNSKLNTSQNIAVALGNVGTQYASVMGQNFSTPPTIKIPAGSGIGLLLMTDLQVPLAEPAIPGAATSS